LPKQNTKQPANYGKYLAAGIIAAGIIFAVFRMLEKNENPEPHKWSKQVDSAFVYNCVSKYRKEFGQDSVKLLNTAEFCLCMLEKVKLKYEETEIEKVTNDDIKEWDRLCRNELMTRRKPR
jgi:hypothetical protein